MTGSYYKRTTTALKSYGAVPSVREARGTVYLFPDGYRLYVYHQIDQKGSRALLSDVGARYGRRHPQAWKAGVRVSGAPNIDLERVVASDHAKERLRLMQSQRRVDLRDVLYALKLPERVLWAPRHNSWAWVRGDIAVPITFAADGSQVIRTVLWASEELWESNPRPEKKR